MQSWDTANKAIELSDFSVCTTWGIKGENLYLLGVLRRRLEYSALKRAVREQQNLLADIRRIPSGFEARIAPLNGLGNGKSCPVGAKGDRSGPLRPPGRWHALIGRHRGMLLPLSPAAL